MGNDLTTVADQHDIAVRGWPGLLNQRIDRRKRHIGAHHPDNLVVHQHREHAGYQVSPAAGIEIWSCPEERPGAARPHIPHLLKIVIWTGRIKAWVARYIVGLEDNLVIGVTQVPNSR